MACGLVDMHRKACVVRVSLAHAHDVTRKKRDQEPGDPPRSSITDEVGRDHPGRAGVDLEVRVLAGKHHRVSIEQRLADPMHTKCQSAKG